MVFGSGMRGFACVIAEVPASSNPASPTAIMVLGMLPSCMALQPSMGSVQITTDRAAWELDVNTA